MEKKSSQKESQNLTPNIFNSISKQKLTPGQRSADKLTKYAGSWIFIITFFIFLVIWMIINAYFLVRYEAGGPWDPYPFILLNLILSCLAAVQAPIILMSQNRATERDRQRVKYDYAVNRKAEREIKFVINKLEKIERRLKKIT